MPLADTSSAPDSPQQQARFTGYANNDKKDIFTPIITGRNYAAIPKAGAGVKPAYNGHKIQARDSSPQLYHEQVGSGSPTPFSVTFKSVGPTG